MRHARWMTTAFRGVLAAILATSLTMWNLGPVPVARAAIFTVNSTADASDNNLGDGVCLTATLTDCTLRAAIEEANALAGADTIQVPGGTYVLTGGTLPVTSTIQIAPTSASAAVTISGGGQAAPVFSLGTGANLQLSQLTVTGATVAPAIDVTDGTLILTTSTLTGNTGGALRLNGATAVATISETTIANNSGGAASVDLAVANATATLTRVTIAGNSGGSVVGGLRVETDAVANLSGSIVANNTGGGADCIGAVTAGGLNIIETPGCTVTGTTPLEVDPVLGGLAPNGGPTQTQLPGTTSPALNAGGACSSTDQRGVTRPRGGACDLGAVELPAVSFAASTFAATDGGGVVTLSATLDGAVPFATSSTFALANGTALAATDYSGTGGSFNFAANTTTDSEDVTILRNTAVTGTRSFSATLTPTAAITTTPASTTVNIADIDRTVTFASTTASVAETAGTVSAVIQLNAAAAQATTVLVSTNPGTALAGREYGPITNTVVTIPQGEITNTVTVNVLDNAWHNASKDFTLTLADGGDFGRVGAPSTATVTITNNEAVPAAIVGSTALGVAENGGSVSVPLTWSPGYTSELPITVTYALASGSALAGVNFADVSGSTTITSTSVTNVTVPITNNVTYSGPLTFTLGLSGQNPGTIGVPASTLITITDDEGEPSASVPATLSVTETVGTAAIPVTLNRTSTTPIVVTYTTSAGTATAGVNFIPVTGTVTFAPLDTSETISVTIPNNGFHSGSVTFAVNLTAQSIGTVGAATTTVTITDDEAIPAAQIETPGGGGYAFGELAGPAVITVTLPYTSTGSVTVNYTTENNTATFGTDYQQTAGNLLFSSGQITGTVSVPILNNNVFTGDRYFTFRLLGQTPGTIGSPASAQVTIIDAQQPPTVQFETTGFNVARNAGSAPITVTLSVAPAVTVTVAYTASNGTALAGVDYVANTGVLTFGPGDTTRAITMTILNTGLYVGDRTFSLTLGNPTAAELGDTAVTTVLIRETNAFRIYLSQIRKFYDPLSEYEPNGTLGNARGPVASAVTYRGGYNADQVDQYGLDRDTWWFTAAGPGQVTVTVTSQDPGRQVKLMNASGADIPGGFTGDPGSTVSFTVTITSAGTYYVRVFNSSQLGVNQYQLRVIHP